MVDWYFVCIFDACRLTIINTYYNFNIKSFILLTHQQVFEVCRLKILRWVFCIITFIMEYILQTYPSVRNNYVGDTTELSQWVSLIKQSKYSEQIEKARKGLKNYDEVKLSLPCINYPFLFTDYKKNANIVKATGLLYFDIDNPLFDPLQLDPTKVCLYHKSFGGNGYVIVVRVEGMTSDSYRYYYKEIAKELGIDELVDYNAAKQVQTNVLSYDKDLYYNSNSKVFTLCPPRVSILKESILREEHIGGGGGQSRTKGFCFSNTELFDFDGQDYYVDWHNIKNIMCYIPGIKRKRGQRNNMLLAFAANFIYLNPHATKTTLLKMLEVVDNKGCEISVGEERLKTIANSVMKYKRQGTLKPVYSKNRSILFNKDSSLSIEEKQKIVGEETKNYWKDISCEKIQDILDSWDFFEDGKITTRSIYQNHPISKKTVDKYYKLFKEDIKKLNEKFADYI